MGKIDTCTKEYISNPRIFADAFNYYFFHGKQVVKPDDLAVQDTTEITLPYCNSEEGIFVPTQKFRDILKMWTIMTSNNATYMLLGVENQTNIHYAMPVRNMLYDSLNYSSQVEEVGRKHRKFKNVKGDEFLSGFTKTDKIKPVFTLVIYWGTKEWNAPRSLYEMLDIDEELNEIFKEYVNDYKIHVIVPNEIKNFEQFSTELGYCFRYIQSSKRKETLKNLIEEYKDIYSNFDKASGYLLECITETKLPKSAKQEDSINMCKAIEEMIEEATENTAKEATEKTARDSARLLFENGGTLEMAIKVFPMLTEEELLSIKGINN